MARSDVVGRLRPVLLVRILHCLLASSAFSGVSLQLARVVGVGSADEEAGTQSRQGHCSKKKHDGRWIR